MSTYTNDTLVKVCPFARRDEGEAVTIGDLQRQVFLTIPAEALVILDCLAEGQTVGAARDEYQSQYGETPDIEDFLEAMESAGFVLAGPDGPAGGREQDPQVGSAAANGAQIGWLTESRARRLCQPGVVVACLALVAGAALLVATDPATVPGPSVLVFKHYLAALSAGMFAFGLIGVAVHELAHLAAARAAGAPARIGVSHRLWVLVAETDMTGIWLTPKRSRYLAFLAGPLVDAVSASLLVGLLWIHRRGWIGLSLLQTQIVGAALLVYLLRLLWQCFVFVRTDFYFVIATAFNCKNLLVDTQAFLRNAVAGVLSPARLPIDQSGIPAAEMRVVRWYSLVWLVGRALALATLFLVTLPILGRYVVAMAPMLIGRRSSYSVIDVLAFGAVTVGFEGAGLVMWMRSLVRQAFSRRSPDAMASP